MDSPTDQCDKRHADGLPTHRFRLVTPEITSELAALQSCFLFRSHAGRMAFTLLRPVLLTLTVAGMFIAPVVVLGGVAALVTSLHLGRIQHVLVASTGLLILWIAISVADGCWKSIKSGIGAKFIDAENTAYFLGSILALAMALGIILDYFLFAARLIP